MKKTHRFIAFVLTVVMFVTMIPESFITAFAEGYYDSSLEGVILTADGAGVEGVSVFVYDITEQEIIDYYDTNSSGKWSTSECVSGNQYLISYYHRDYEIKPCKFIVGATVGTVVLENAIATFIGVDANESDASLFEYEILNGSYVEITKYIGAEETVVIPQTIDRYTVQSINDGAFQNNEAIRVVALPETVEILGNSVFRNCKNLSTVYLNSGITMIGDNTFRECSV